MGFLGGGIEKLSANAGDTRGAGLIPGSGRCPGVGNGNPLQYSCLENPVDSGAQQAAVCRVAKSQTSQHARTRAKTALHARILDRNKNWFVFVCVLRLYLFAVLIPFLKTMRH